MMTSLGNGVVLTDGAGGKIYVADKPPKGKKVRYIRMERGKSCSLYKDDRMTTAWEVERETGTLHPTQKPVEIPTRAIENSSKSGEIVLDLFGGSGSTLIAAESAGRRGYTTELDTKYVDVIISRYVMLTGNTDVVCVRDGEELHYLDLVRQWAKDNGKEAELAGMKCPVVVCKPQKAKRGEAQ